MKKLKHIMISAILLSFAGVFTACGEKETEEFFYEIFDFDFPFNCNWVSHEIYYNEVTIINSNRELEKHINWREGHSFPAVDFRRNTLLLARGTWPQQARVEEVTLLQNCKLEYTLNVALLTGAHATPVKWTVGVLTYKIPNNANITLIVEVLR